MLSSQGREQHHLANTEPDDENSVSELMGRLTQARISDLMEGFGAGLHFCATAGSAGGFQSHLSPAHKLCKAVAQVQTLTDNF